ncbi:MAG: hypothetical protein MJZ37_06650 [Bacilli bacterium]|nr:hypothetical protein [Bacilli bacterium]
MKKDNEHLCPICGQPTVYYMGNYRKDGLCMKHSSQLKNGEIVLEDGLFKDAKTKKVLNKDYKEPEPKPSEKEVKVEKYCKCISCGRKVEPGFLFCPECYKKYANKELLVKITHCKEVNILDDSYEGRYTCKDGHVVKSKAEIIIDNYLFEHMIPHAYEKALPIDADPEHDLHPDFCLPNFKGKGKDIYLEYWGYNENNIKYTESKNYKIKCYKERKVTIISLEDKDISDIEASLGRKLEFYKEDTIND